MKITNAYVNITSPGRNFVTLKIEIDEGIYGLGDGTFNGRELAVASYLTDHVLPCILGDYAGVEDGDDFAAYGKHPSFSRRNIADGS